MTSLSVRGLRVPVGAGRSSFAAVDGVELDVPASGVVGLVGESGSGKSTLARAIVGFVPASHGEVLLGGKDYRGARGRRLRELRRRVQVVFQDPRASLNPRMTVGQALAEAVSATQGSRGASNRAEVARLLELVGLDLGYAQVRPVALSGGERQRVAVARALAARPDVIIADEITSALDASVQAAMLNMLREVRAQTGLSMLFISHNIAVVRYVSDAIGVMHLGRIVECGPTEQLVRNPQHPYTRTLMESVSLDGFASREPEGEPPDPLRPPSGCRYRTMCPAGPLDDPERGVCIEKDPAAGASRRIHRAACHFVPLVGPREGDTA